MTRRHAAIAAIDVLVLAAVLNVAAATVPAVVSESFSDSLLTAVLLEAVLEVVLIVKRALVRRIRGAAGPLGRAAWLATLWLVLVASKFAVLETVDLVLGSRVSLGGFWSVTGLILVLTLARLAVRAGLDAWLGGDRPRPTPRSGDAPEPASPQAGSTGSMGGPHS